MASKKFQEEIFCDENQFQPRYTQYLVVLGPFFDENIHYP